MNNNNDGDNIRRTSLRIDESLALKVDKLAENDGRSFNNQILELIKKGIELVESERKFLRHVEPVQIVRSTSAADEDDPPKHSRAPDDELETGK